MAITLIIANVLRVLPYYITLLSENYLYYVFYLFRMNINYTFFYSENVINTRVLKNN
jgi:hypothetical protein